ncbi:MAG: trigger factor [Ignavibacteriales bacterium]|nr:trigger factor [Ignavibacteriales bacterium]
MRVRVSPAALAGALAMAGAQHNAPYNIPKEGSLYVEVTLHSLSDVSKEVEIRATAQELEPHFDKAFRGYQAKVEIKGFRKGRAPLELVKKLYGDLIEQDSLESVANELYRKAVQEKELKPIGEPLLVDMDYKKGEGVRFKIKYDVRPPVELRSYKGIPVEKVVHKVSDQEVEAEIARLQRMNASVEEVPRVTGSEHIVTVEMQELDVGGVPLIGKKSDSVRFYLADPQLEQPFKDALQSAETGGEYRVKFEHQHGDHQHNVHAALRVKKVESVTLPGLTDEFVSKITKGKVLTVEKLRDDVKQDLIAYWNAKSERQVLNSVTGELIRRHDFDVPESLIRSVLAGLLEEVKNESPNKQLPKDFDAEKFFQENRAYAIYQAKWALIREELIRAEKITVEDADLFKLAEQESSKIGIDKERLVNYYKSSDQVKDRVVGEKLMKLLLESAKIMEVEEKQPVL